MTFNQATKFVRNTKVKAVVSTIACLLVGSTAVIPPAKAIEPVTVGAGVIATLGAVNAVGSHIGPGSRSVILEVGNGSNTPLRAVSYRHSRGRFRINPQGEVPPNTWNLFGAKSTKILTGTEGSVTYAGDGINFVVSWNNPWAGKNKCNATLSGPNAENYRLFYACGGGNTNARMTYQLFSR